MVSRECQEFLDKLNNSDPDNRLMAISDVSTMLKSLQTNLSKEDSKQYTTALVSKLTDGHTHVEAEATSCLGQLLKFIDNDAATSTIEGICTSMAKAEFGTKTGTLSAALRIVVGQLPDSVDSKGMVAGLAKPITATLAKVPAKASYDIKVDLIDALAEILVRAGGYMSSSNNLVDDVQGILLAALNDASAAVRRRAISALGKFIISVPEEFSNKALNEIFERYSKSSDKNEANKYLRILVLIIRQTPLRIANLVQIVIDRELSTLETVEESERELRITSLSAFETILNECPELAKGKIEQIYDAAISALNYDPNYSYDDNSDDDDENGMDEDGDEDSEDFEDEFDDDIYADDEDDSWEIRMSAVKLLTALIGSGLFTAEAIISRIGTSLVSSFREREDVVRAEILIAFANMLVKTKELASKSQESDMDVEDTLVDQLAEQTPQIVNSLLSAIKSYPKSTETKQLAFVIFRRLVAINKPILRGLLSKIAPQVQGALGAKDSSSSLQSASTKLVKPNLKLDALDFLLELTSCDSLTSELRDFIESLKDCVSASIQSANFLVPSAALDVVSQFLVLLRTAADNDGIDTAPFQPWIQEAAKSGLSLTSSSDQTLRHGAYKFTGSVLRQFGDYIDPEITTQSLGALTVWKASNVDTPLPTINALVWAISQPTHLPRDRVIAVAQTALENALPLLSLSDSKQSIAALQLISAVCQYGSEAVGTIGDDLAKGVLVVINRSNLSPPVPALTAYTNLCPYMSEDMVDSSDASLMRSLAPPSIHDIQSISALATLHGTIAKHFPAVALQWQDRLFKFWEQGYSSYYNNKNSRGSDSAQAQFPDTAIDNTAKCLLQLLRGYYESQGQHWTSGSLASYIKPAPKIPSEIAPTCLSLRVLGHAANAGILEQSQQLVDQLYAYIDSKNDDVCNEASIALGSCAACFTDVFTDLFSRASSSQGDRQTYELLAIKQAVDVAIGTNHDESAADFAWAELTKYVQKSETPVPEIVAQCLSVFGLTFPRKYLPSLVSNVNAAHPVAAVTFVTAFRTVLAGKQVTSECDEQIGLALPELVKNLANSDVSIRRLILLSIYTVVQTKPRLLGDLGSAIQPDLFKQTAVDSSLVRVINMGPFKKTIDDGLENRRCAYQCVYMFVRNLPQVVDSSGVVDSIIRGIGDVQEIRAIVQLIVAELAASKPDVLTGRLDDIAESLDKKHQEKPPKNPSKIESDLYNDMLTSVVAILISLEPVLKRALAQSSPASKFESLRAKAADPENKLLNPVYVGLRSAAAGSSP